MAKYRCNKTNCTRSVKKDGEMCWQHKGIEDQVGAGIVEADALAGQGEQGTNPSMPRKEKGLVETPADIEHGSASYAPKTDTELHVAILQEGLRLTGLAALIRTPAPPPEPDGLLIPFTHEEIIALIESDVTRDHIREFVIMGLDGKLVLAASPDPLAMSRVNAAG